MLYRPATGRGTGRSLGQEYEADHAAARYSRGSRARSFSACAGAHPGRGAAAPHALRRADRRHQVRRPRHGRPGAGRSLRPGHRLPQAVGRQPDRRARRRPADRRHAEEAADQVRVRARPARHRQAHRRGGRDGARRPHQQGHRHGHQPAGRQGGRHLRQGCQPDDRPQDHRDGRPRVEPDEGGRHRLCRRSGRGQPAHRRGDLQVGPHPRHRAGRHQPRGRDAQHQRRHVRQRARRPHEGQAPAAADRRRRRARQGQQAHRTS